jgi:hypothetical protein
MSQAKIPLRTKKIYYNAPAERQEYPGRRHELAHRCLQKHSRSEGRGRYFLRTSMVMKEETLV